MGTVHARWCSRSYPTSIQLAAVWWEPPSRRKVALPGQEMGDFAPARDLKIGNHLGDPPKLVEIGTGWDELDFVGADRVELPQHREQLVLAAGKSGRRRHRVDILRRNPVHVAAQMAVHLLAGVVAGTKREPERRREV